jgi:hypothetical protein
MVAQNIFLKSVEIADATFRTNHDHIPSAYYSDLDGAPMETIARPMFGSSGILVTPDRTEPGARFHNARSVVWRIRV